MIEYKVIDVSYAQGRIDWSKVKGNVDAVIIRCGYGSDIPSQDDNYWLYNVSEAERLNIPYAVYLYSYATNKEMARSEAAHVLRLIKGRKPWRVYYDLEETGLGPVSRANADVFCKIIADAGYKPGVYTFESWFNSYMRGYKNYPLWIAKVSQYRPSVGVPFEGWQYTFSARIPGINTNVDCSRFYSKLWDDVTPEPPQKAPQVTYGIKTLHHGIIADTGNGAALEHLSDAITGIKIGVTAGSIEYRVHCGGRWLPKVTGNDWKDYQNGYAGDDVNPIDAIQIYYYSPGEPFYQAVYSVKAAGNSRFYPSVYDTDFETEDGPGTAGVFGKPITAIRIKLNKV